MARRRSQYLVTNHALERFRQRINPAGNEPHMRRLLRESIVADDLEAWKVRKNLRTVCLVHASRRIVFICERIAHGRLAVKTCFGRDVGTCPNP